MIFAILLGGLIVIALVLVVAFRDGGRKGQVIKVVTDATFAEALRSERLVLADFRASWCKPCRQLTPVLAALAEEYAGRLDVIAIDIDESPATAQRHGIMSVPTVILFRDGDAVSILRNPSRSTLRIAIGELA